VIAQIKQIAKRSKTGIIGYRIYDDWRAGRRFNSAKIASLSSSAYWRKSTSETVIYIKEVFGDYLKYSGISAEMLEGKRVLEVGHGNNFGVALMFLAAGASQVVCLDKLYWELDIEEQGRIYRALRSGLDEPARKRFDEAINLEKKIEVNSQKLQSIYGTGLEHVGDMLDAGSFDLIVSRAVLEYAVDSDAAFSAMDGLLTNGGSMIHKIDLRDDGMFSSNGMHPLTFLTIPNRLYRLMTINSGRCNRKLIDYYKQKMRDLAYATKFFVTAIVGRQDELLPHKQEIEWGVDFSESTISLINSIRPALAREYKRLSNVELMTAGILLVATKPSPLNPGMASYS
jgi:SAM-dependent methyltransferase